MNLLLLNRPRCFSLWSLMLAATFFGFSGSRPANAQSAGTGQPVFKSILAIKAAERYGLTQSAASKRFVDELDRNLKFALQAGALEEANQIEAAKKLAITGAAVTVDLKRSNLVSGRDQYRDSLVAAKGQYYRDLEVALRESTKAGDLQEANTIDAVRKAIESELADGKITGKIENGLWLTIGAKKEIWENKAITLPSNQTKVTLEGVLLLTGKVRTVKLRSAKAGGSERLRFTVDGKECQFEMENGSHRYVIVAPQPGSDRMRLLLGNSIAANEWLFGPLEWSLNEGSWREIPLRSMLAVD
jgi:hypothetical protein